MKEIIELTQEIVIELIRYDRTTGKAYWNKRDVKWFKDGKYSAQRVCNCWNAKNAGKEIDYKNGEGYIMLSLLGETVFLQRILWFRETGEWPDKVDHINGNTSDNRWCNLRNVSNQENCKNRKLRSDNTSGVTGVHWNSQRGKWHVQIADFNGNGIYLGLFDLFEEAVAVRKAAEIEYGYSERHGKELNIDR